MNAAAVLRMHCDTPTHARLHAFLVGGGTVSDSPESYGWSLVFEAANGRLRSVAGESSPLTQAMAPASGEAGAIVGRIARVIDPLDE